MPPATPRQIRRDWLRAILVVEGDQKVHEVFDNPLLSGWTRIEIAVALEDLRMANEILVRADAR